VGVHTEVVWKGRALPPKNPHIKIHCFGSSLAHFHLSNGSQIGRTPSILLPPPIVEQRNDHPHFGPIRPPLHGRCLPVLTRVWQHRSASGQLLHSLRLEWDVRETNENHSLKHSLPMNYYALWRYDNNTSTERDRSPLKRLLSGRTPSLFRRCNCQKSAS
jgi:hypothetical protein